MTKRRIRRQNKKDGANPTIAEAEAWSVLNGLQLAWNRGYRAIILETDSLIKRLTAYLVFPSMELSKPKPPDAVLRSLHGDEVGYLSP
ncbi:hypothetical protein OROMI_023597 [Orobanche minor]